MNETMQDIPEPVIESVEEVLPLSRRASLMRFARRVSGAQFVRYIIVGTWNTAVGYSLFAYFTFLFTKYSVHGYIYAAFISNAIAITVAFFGYKFFVFRTRGNYLKEYMRCVTVYGSAALPGIPLLAALKNIIAHYAKEHPRSFIAHGHILTLQALSPYLAQALITGCTIFYSFFGHRKFSFKVAPSQQN
jgi:putative flippase GtrA